MHHKPRKIRICFFEACFTQAEKNGMEVEGNQPDVVQAIGKALRGGFSGIGEHLGEDGAVQTDETGEPRKKVV